MSDGADKLLDCITQELGGGAIFVRLGEGVTGAAVTGGVELTIDGTLAIGGSPPADTTPPEDCMTQELGGFTLTVGLAGLD